jgi:hypothetical protein
MKKFISFLGWFALLVTIGVYGYSLFLVNFDFSPSLTLFSGFVKAPFFYVNDLLENGFNTALSTIVTLSVGGLGLVLTLILVFKKLFQKRIIGSLVWLLISGGFTYFAVGLLVPTFSLTNDDTTFVRAATYALSLFESGAYEELLLTVGILFLLTGSLFLLSFAQLLPKKRKAKTQKVVVEEKVEPTTIPVAPQVNQPEPEAQDGSLSELVKLVLAEEIQAMKQPTAGGYYPQNPNPYGYQVDPNLIRRIVSEELIRFQTLYISRAEVQTMLAQEIALLKAKLNIK